MKPEANNNGSKWHLQNILVIDNNKETHDSLEVVFPEYEFNWTDNGKRGLQFVNENKEVDLVILEYFLPKINGLETLKRIKKSKPGVEVIVLTSTETIIEKAMETGAFGVIEKPLDFDDLQEMLWCIMDEKRSKG